MSTKHWKSRHESQRPHICPISKRKTGMATSHCKQRKTSPRSLPRLQHGNHRTHTAMHRIRSPRPTTKSVHNLIRTRPRHRPTTYRRNGKMRRCMPQLPRTENARKQALVSQTQCLNEHQTPHTDATGRSFLKAHLTAHCAEALVPTPQTTSSHSMQAAQTTLTTFDQPTSDATAKQELRTSTTNAHANNK